MENITEKAELTANFIESFDNNLSIISVGYNNFAYVLPFYKKRVQKFFTVHFVLSGKGFYEIHGKRHKLRKYDFFLIPPNETVSYYPDKSEPWTYVWICFSGDNAALLSSRMGFDNKPYFKCNSPYVLYSLVKKFFDELETTGEVGYFAALSMFYSIIDINTNIEKLKPQSLRDQVISYIDVHFHDANLKIGDICSYFNISHSHLCNLFKDGQTVKEILSAKRLEEAKRLLTESDLFVGEVGRSVGFMNTDHFMKVFKKATGMSAGEYRRFARERKKDETEPKKDI